MPLFVTITRGFLMKEKNVDKEQLRLLYVVAGMSLRDVAKELNNNVKDDRQKVSRMTVSRRLEKWGFKKRNKSEAMTGRELSPATKKKISRSRKKKNPLD